MEKCLQENPQLANLWTPESNYSVRTSMYNKDARSQSVAPVMQRNLISGGANSQERDKLQNECNRIAQVACPSSAQSLVLTQLSCEQIVTVARSPDLASQ